MALSNYDDLVQAVVNWSHRDDIDLLIPDFIVMAENEMFGNNQEVLKIRALEATTTQIAIADTRLNPLPTDFLYNRRVRLDLNSGDNGELVYKAPEQMIIQGASGRPYFFTITDQLEFDRVPDSTYNIEFSYYARPLPLDSVNTENAVMTNHPEIYLYGCLKQLFIYAMDEQEAAKYGQLFTNAIKGANKKDKKGRYGPSPSMSTQGVKP